MHGPATPWLQNRRNAALVTLAYLMAALAWIRVSDELGAALFTTPAALASFQATKGVGFAIASALLLYWLLTRQPDPALAAMPRGGGRLAALLVALSLAIALPLIVLLGVALNGTTRGTLREAHTLVASAAARDAARLESFIASRQRLLSALWMRPGFDPTSESGCSEVVLALQSLHPAARRVAVFDASQRELCASRPAPDAARLPPAPVADHARIGGPYRAGEEWLATITYPVLGAGRLEGSVQILLGGRDLVAVVQPERDQPGMSSTVIDSEGRAIAREPDGGIVGAPGVRLPPPEVLRALKTGTPLARTGPDGIERVYAARPVNESGVWLVVGFPSERVYGPAREAAWESGLLATGVLVLALLVAARIGRSIDAPIRALAHTAAQVARGDLHARAPVAGPTEVRNVAIEFNGMLDRLGRQNEELEAGVAQRTRELARANEALESFSYSVAHDLRAPLQALRGFSGYLGETIAQGQTARAVHFAERIEANAARMEEMVDGLLALSRVDGEQRPDGPVDLGVLVQDVVRDLPLPPLVQLAVGPLPVVRGDAGLIRQALRNLLHNAVKYSSQTPDPRVEVQAELRQAEIVLSVRDNGVGFDPEHAGRLFAAFSRLHSAQDFEGTGIGLAIVRRVAERHGGRVWAEGRPGEGATFFLALPRERLAGPA